MESHQARIEERSLAQEVPFVVLVFGEEMRQTTRLILLAIFIALLSHVWATNGMNMIGYGVVSSGMDGADLAVVDNASAMNINPAEMC